MARNRSPGRNIRRAGYTAARIHGRWAVFDPAHPAGIEMNSTFSNWAFQGKNQTVKAIPVEILEP